MSERKVKGVIRSLVNIGSLNLECMGVHETLLVLVLLYAQETMIWRKRSRICAMQIDNFRGLLDIRRMKKKKSRMRR